MERSDHAPPSVRLPLRLAAEPFARQLSRTSVALGLHRRATTSGEPDEKDVELAMVVDDDGVRAFCSSRLVARSTLLSWILGDHRREAEVPCESIRIWTTQSLWVLVRSSAHSNALQWHCYRGSEEVAIPMPSSSEIAAASSETAAVHDVLTARLVTQSIRRYYAQQILEPSVRGFLSVLEKQFARSDLYLFELLQNAVDDGATLVRFQVVSAQRQGNPKGSLQVSHNGRPFTPLDVLGLSSVGLSTKPSRKRTIGFMGVGFKAVYKRYAKVGIRDGTYSFVYQEPMQKGDNSSSVTNKDGYGWVMLPIWNEEPTKTTHSMSQRIDMGAEGSMCHFSLECPRGGMASIVRDLAVLPATAPPLLGRAALVKRNEESVSARDNSEWTLDWNGKVHVVKRTCIQSYTPDDASEVVTVTISDQHRQRTSKWLFVSHKFLPSASARESYLQHTKRSHAGQEEVCGFVNLASSMSDQSPHKPGRIHLVLPTKITLPLPLHCHGSWLLSIDRQQVQDLSDNAWNVDILKVLPDVVANFFRWGARSSLSGEQRTLEDYKALWPLLPKPSPQNPQMMELLGQCISLRGLMHAFLNERILPVALPSDRDATGTASSDSSTIVTGFDEGKHSIWVPPSFLMWVPPNVLRIFLGKRPLRTDIMGEAAYHPLFASTSVIGQLDESLLDRRVQLCQELVRNKQQPDVKVLIQIMAAIGAGYDEHPDHQANGTGDQRNSVVKQNNTKNQASASVTVACPYFPASTKSWPVFLMETGMLATVDQVALPSEEFATVPKDLVELLCPYFTKKEGRWQQQSRQKSFGNDSKRAKKHNRVKPMPVKILNQPLQRLHPLLEGAIISVYKYGAAGLHPDNGKDLDELADGKDWGQLCGAVSSFLRRARAEVQSNVVGVSSAAANLFEFYSKQPNGTLTDENLTSILKVAKFALETDNHHLLSFVLVDDLDSCLDRINSSRRLIPAAEAYAGKSLDENGRGISLEHFAGRAIPYVSNKYNSILEGSVAKQKKLLKLLSLAGVQTGLSVCVSAIFDVEQDRATLMEEVVPNLPEQQLPPLRKNNTKTDVLLPYGLGKVMNRRKFSLIDAQLSPEWEPLINTMSPESAVGFISLLLELPVEDYTTVTAKNVAAAANCLLGQTEEVSVRKNTPDSGSGHLLTTRISNAVAVPLRRRLFFLPPGQPGASALDISEACIMKQLQRLKWLPCAVASSDINSLTLLCPDEALLEPSESHPEMPVVQLPADLLYRLKASLIAHGLTWGTKAPAPPVAELVELTKKAKVAFRMPSGNNQQEQMALVASRLLSVWKAIARAHLRGGLTESHLETIRSLAEQTSNRLIPVRRVLETCDNSKPATDLWIVSPDRCVQLPESLRRDNLKELSIAALVASNFMCDFNRPMHNPFYSNPEITAAIIKLVGIKAVMEFPTDALIRTSATFVQYCCKKEPIISSRQSSIRTSFSYAMRWCIDAPRGLASIDGGIKVWVRNGPGVGPKALRRRWVSLKNGPVQAVLDDSRLRSQLLTPDMGIQLLGVLDHTEHERDCPDSKLLAQVDKEVIQHCGLMRLSDSRFVVRTKARGTGVVLEGADSKAQLICALLKYMELIEGGRELSGENVFLSPDWDSPLIIRHDSLGREFRAPGIEPLYTPMYAVFGRTPKSKEKCILVCGGPDDYSVELEELILRLVGITSSPSSQTKPYRAAMRLLSHLENDASFNKFLERDFADFEAVTKRWLHLVERNSTIESLQKAEKAKDAKELRRILISAEELFENDPDGGDALIQSARDVLSVLEAKARDERVKERDSVLKQLKEAATAKDAMLLRSILVRAEELCKDDLNGYGAELQSARNVLSHIEVEAKENGAGRGRGVGRTLPAWMTSNDGPTAGKLELGSSGKAPQNNGKSDNMSVPSISVKTETDCQRGGVAPSPGEDPWGHNSLLQHSNEAPGIPQPVPSAQVNSTDECPSISLHHMAAGNSDGIGRGRGVSNIPAWMEKGEKLLVGPTAAASRGRGITNLPAWMTNPSTGKLQTNGSGEDNAGSTKESAPSSQAKMNAESILRDTAVPAIAMPDVPTNNHSGRGRGVSNLPAWMTNKYGLLEGPSRAPPQHASITGGVSDSSWKTNPSSDKLQTNCKYEKVGLKNESTHCNQTEGTAAAVGNYVPAGVPTDRYGSSSRVPILPALMTNKDDLVEGSSMASAAPTGRCRDVTNEAGSLKRTLEGAGDKRPAKKTCNKRIISQYTLELSMDSDRESKFIDWLTPKIQDEAKLRGGSASLLLNTRK